MEIIKIHNNELTGKYLNKVIQVLKDGEVIIMPTDTLYAVACDALNPKAVEKVCKIKGINPEKTNLSIICSDISMAAEYAKIDNYAFKLMKDKTPGPFTFLFRAASTLPRAFKGRKIVGVRIPDNEADRELAKNLGNPLLSTSISYEEEDYGINPELIAENYEGKVELITEGENGSLTPSAIIDCTGNEPEIIREGPIPLE